MVTGADLRGVHVALATPLDDAGGLDTAALDRLVARVLDGGVTGVCPTGSTGEGPRLTREQRHTVTAEVRARVPATTPLIPAPSALNATEAVAEIAGLADAGADAALVAAPSYYPMEPAEVGGFYARVADGAPVPVVIYNIPMMTKVSVPPPVVGELARHPNIIGIKDSSRDFEYLQAIVYATAGAEFTVLTGSDTMLLASLVLGAAGTIAASANLVPWLSRAVYDAVQAGDLTKAAAVQEELFHVVQACRVGIAPAGWKAGLSLVGVCGPTPAAPARPLGPQQMSTLTARLEELGVR